MVDINTLKFDEKGLIPAIVVDEFTMVINLTTAEMLGAEIPADVLAAAVIVE